MSRSLAGRLAVAAAAVAAALALTLSEGGRDRCEDASRDAFLSFGATARALDRATRELVADCDGSEPLTRIAVGLLDRGRDRPAAYLARAAVRREPGNWAGWAVLARTSAGPDAVRRARELNPLAPRSGR